MNERVLNLDQLFQHTWQLLSRASLQKKHTMRTPVLGTAGTNGPNLRTVVLRKVDQQVKSVFFFTDRRSEKVKDIRTSATTAVTFYDPKKQFQITLKGNARLHAQDELAQSFWERVPSFAHKDYSSVLAPGTPIEAPGRPMEGQDSSDSGYVNFVVIELVANSIDCLQLSREGHVRAKYTRKGKTNEWESVWVVP
ncbi:MAG: pyridoxamine 5'-phosphate oxidase family protein [Bacteroidota bacterium]